MYQGTTIGSGGALAMTGAAATVYGIVGAWTLVVAGLALLTIVRVMARRRRAVPEPSR
ncbi:hypothetical protein GCM10009718_17950 [Isoptericola halotolerans]|uniref:Membrane protein implicated in regulation of membrane protease activity n=1 Tax=Isoptericola halotolerans TaxID=300560 RepID=A0ABX2A719_9MICO|nr:hypothetical protein [Isoptericola halotolerans]NOV98618.1 membrane protein implicated in regulation of membrane protease activity [Isoptericola halotolerans]